MQVNQPIPTRGGEARETDEGFYEAGSQEVTRLTEHDTQRQFRVTSDASGGSTEGVALPGQRPPQCQQPPTSTASDTAMQNTMEQTRKAIHRLQAESASWESLLDKHRSKAEELARQVEQCQEKGVMLDASCLAQSSQSQLIQNKPDYHSLLCRQQTVLSTMDMVMDTQCKMVRELLSIQEQSQLLVKETSRRLAWGFNLATFRLLVQRSNH
ncbi:uncharacterized protein LOC115196073 isoform X4 [Salmo trutta]|uniref:uncharacterized protein LOC115196073 isoform X4 n=1 Tax=Salmo trutta TaxID=8032 RepID=UPI0011301C83|nr:uncharacterized protein LOC115196073 isoform X4 [Salmo trutta]